MNSSSWIAAIPLLLGLFGCRPRAVEASAPDEATSSASIEDPSSSTTRHGGPWLEWPFADGIGRIYQGYGQAQRDNPIDVHEGLDLAVPAGTPVYSPLKGEVSMNFEVGYPSYEQGIAIRGFSGGDEIFIKLLHMDRASIQVLLGDHVEAGDYLGNVVEWGGDSAFESHLHIEIGGAALYAKMKEREDGLELNARNAFSPIKNPLAWLKRPQDDVEPAFVPISENDPMVFRAYRERSIEDETPGAKLDANALHGPVDIEFGLVDGYSRNGPKAWLMPHRVRLEIVTADAERLSILDRSLTLDGPLETTSIYSRRIYLEPPPQWSEHQGFCLRLLSLRGLGGEGLAPEPWDTASCDPGPYLIRLEASDFDHRDVVLAEIPVRVAER